MESFVHFIYLFPVPRTALAHGSHSFNLCWINKPKLSIPLGLEKAASPKLVLLEVKAQKQPESPVCLPPPQGSSRQGSFSSLEIPPEMLFYIPYNCFHLTRKFTPHRHPVALHIINSQSRAHNWGTDECSRSRSAKAPMTCVGGRKIWPQWPCLEICPEASPPQHTPLF